MMSESDLQHLLDTGLVTEDVLSEIVRADLGTRMNVWMPMVKAMVADDKDPNGTIIHHGIASDNSVDLEGDMCRQEIVAKSLPYLRDWGTFNWMHQQEDIGNVLEARVMSASAIADLLGRTVVDAGTYVKGTLYPIVDVSIAPKDLITARHRMLADARLGYSLHGTLVRNRTGVSAVFANAVAIAPQPMNTNAAAMMLHKSITAAADAYVGHTEEPEGMQVVYPLLAGETIAPADTVTISKPYFGLLLRKAMMAGGGVDAAQFTGGRALQHESLEGRTECECAECGKPFTAKAGKETKLCPKCQRKMMKAIFPHWKGGV